MKLDPEHVMQAIGCRSDFELGGFLGDIHVDGIKGLTELRGDPADLDAKAKKYELIEQVRAGKHAVLGVTARTFRQQKGRQNRRYLRLGGDLASNTSTFAKQPFLVDHATWTQSSRKGTILTAKLVEETQTRVAFEMAFEAVKPDAVISVLDGTLDRFSIGWFALGPVLCTVHGVDVRGSDSCMCWPGEIVMMDGKPQTVEYEFTAWSGKELSGVNIPAVQNTNIEEIRAALAAELDLPRRPRKKEPEMKFAKLARALKLEALDSESDEDAAVRAVERLRESLNLSNSAALMIKVDAAIAKAYREGKLGYRRDDQGEQLADRREERLRRIAKAPEHGLADLEAELAELDVTIPVGKRLQSEGVAEPARAELDGIDDNPHLNDALDDIAHVLGGEDPEKFKKQMLAFRSGHIRQGGA